MPLFALATGITVTVCLLLTLSHGGNRLLSSVLNWFLVRRYAVRHLEHGNPLPTCPYIWPNGQGDVGKFLEGIYNSEKWRKRYGGIYRIWAGMKPEVVLTKPEHIKAIFKDSDKHQKAVNNDSGYLMSRILGKCVGLISGDEWKRLRTVSGSAFTQRNIVHHVDMIHRRAINYLNDCEQTGRLRDHLIDPVEDLKMLPFFTVADVIYGELSPSMEQELREMAPVHERLFKHVIRGGLSRFWLSKYLPTEANRLLNDFETKWMEFNHSAYQRASAQGLVETPIFSLFHALEEGTIDPEHVHHTLDEALYANLDVTMGGLSWNLVFLAANKESQKRLRAEIKDVRQKGNIHQYLLSSTSFLAACIAESSRLKPLAAFSVPQSAPTDRVIDGYHIPAKTNFVIDTYAINIQNEFWGTDAHKYRPTRFLEVNSAEARYNFWRFGFGPRQCMGRYVADVIIRALLVELIDRWELHLPKELEGREWGRDADTWITHPQMQLSCTPISYKEKVGL